jgi:hypothetical protein
MKKIISTIGSCVTTLFLISLMIFSPGCSKIREYSYEGNTCPKSVQAKLLNKTGLDACGWILELANGEHLEPTNLRHFNIELREGKAVYVNYAERHDLGSACMVGRIVEIKWIKEKY